MNALELMSLVEKLPPIELEKFKGFFAVAYPIGESKADRALRLARDRKRKQRDSQRDIRVTGRVTETGHDDGQGRDSGFPSLHSPLPSETSLSLSDSSSPDSPDLTQDPGLEARAREASGTRLKSAPALALPTPKGFPPDIIELRDVYCEAVASVTGMRFAIPSSEDQSNAFIEALRQHGRDEEGPFVGAHLRGWLRVTAIDFAKFVQSKQRGPDAKFWRPTPRCFVNWLNETPLVGAEAAT